jgi:preprotein translocase subunit SecG
MNHWIFVALVVLHIFVCVLLVLLILIQNDKGGGLAGAFGGMGGGAAFSGSSAATFLTKLTQGAAFASFILLLGLNYLSTKGIDKGQRESELKSARHGLSSVLPTSAPATSGGIPGLGSAPAATTPDAAAPSANEGSESMPSAPASAPVPGTPGK